MSDDQDDINWIVQLVHVPLTEELLTFESLDAFVNQPVAHVRRVSRASGQRGRRIDDQTTNSAFQIVGLPFGDDLTQIAYQPFH